MAARRKASTKRKAKKTTKRKRR